MSGQERQAYDRGTSLFSPDGRIYQVEYAREAVSRGAPAVGVRAEDGVVLGAVVATGSSLQVSESVEKLHRVDDHIGAATAGHAADGRKLVDRAREVAQRERLRFEEAISVEALTTAIADDIQEHTQSGGTRPYGAAVLFGGVDDDGPALYAVGPEGAPETWRATAIGRGRDDIHDFLTSSYSTDVGLDEAQSLAADALSEADEELEPEDVRLAVVGEAGYRELGADEVADLFE